jgi:hypothetical protein
MKFGRPAQKRRREWLLRVPSLLVAAGLSVCVAALTLADAVDRGTYPGASAAPGSRPGWQRFEAEPDPNAPQDEPQGGRTARGTPVPKRSEDSFPAEWRNVFSEVDKVPNGPKGELEPFDFTDGKAVTAEGRRAIQGQNTWILWGGGNEAFWGWLDEHNYGLVDFLILLDSRKREHRFRDAGLMNQPGMKTPKDPSQGLHELLGLYLDEGDGDAVLLRPSKPDSYASTYPPAYADKKCKPTEHGWLYCDVIALLPKDGVDPEIYGYPSGVIGLRLMPNPDFFGNTKEAATARAYWEKRVTRNSDKYYIDADVNADAKLVRPFRVAMSCGFCHVGPHPLNPPTDPANPQWSNLSSTIGNQYWYAASIFSNLAKKDNFLYHLIASEQPGTVDTSLISTDQINNANTINAVFDIPARLVRAKENTPEQQSPANMLSPSVEEDGANINPRHTPRVLLDGADSIGAFGALTRVYVNIGTFSEEWLRLHNPIIGFKPQSPFSVKTLRANSVYWRTSEKYRVPYLVAFFTYKSIQTGQGITAPMKLADTPAGRKIIDSERPLARQGRRVFLEHCAICHSSKQPPGFRLSFSREWAKKQETDAHYGTAERTLPMDFSDWEHFKKSSAYQQYVSSISKMAGVPSSSQDDFFRDNFLSTEIRIPVTLVGTNSARAMGTNAMRGQMWDNFSSEDYKNLPSVGPVRFYNPYSGIARDEWGNNDAYLPPKGGPGYYRPASLISVWATAPYLHNNSLGMYNRDPSVQGRLAAFEDAVDKLLWKSKRVPEQNRLAGDLSWDQKDLARSDPGFVYRTPVPTSIFFPRKFIRPLVDGIVDPLVLSLAFYIGVGVTILLGILAWYGRPRHAGFAMIVIAVLVGIGLVVTRVDRVYWQVWALPAILLAAGLWFWQGQVRRRWAHLVLGSLFVLSLVSVITTQLFLNGRLWDLQLGPIPQGTPVSLIANINPDAPSVVLVDAVSALARGILRVRKDELQGSDALKAFEREAGLPLLRASKCPDFVLDRGHWFGEGLSDDEKRSLKAFLKTL